MATDDPTEGEPSEAAPQPDASPAPPGRAVLAAGTELAGRFRIRRVISRGGFGITYEGSDARLDRLVAVKELFPPGAVREGGAVVVDPGLHGEFVEARGRLLREARSLARFTDPGIVGVYEMFEERGTAYLVLEHLTGPSLSEVMSQRHRPLTEADVLAVVHCVGRALRVVHDAGLLHRDVSPSNLIVGPHGRVVLIDFGLAKVFAPDQTSAMTRIVTPGYAPPEQYAGTDRFGPPSDIYALAATAFRLLTARIPPTAIERQAGAEMASVRHFAPEVSRLVADAIGDGLELERHHRPQTAPAFLARLGLDPDADPDPLSTELAQSSSVGTAAVAGAGAGAAGVATLAGAELDHDATAGGSAGNPTDAAPSSARPAADVGDTGAGAEWRAEDTGWADGEPASAAWEADEFATGARMDPGIGVAAVDDGVTAVAPARSDDRVPPGSGSLGDELQPHRARVAHRPDPRRSLGAPGRWRTTLPITLGLLSLASALPVLLVPVLVVIGLPAIATIGDLVVQAWLAETAQPATWSQRTPLHTCFARPPANLLRGLGRSLPGLVILALVIASWYPLESSDGLVEVADVYLRVGSLAGVAAIWVPTLGGSLFFHSGLAFDALHEALWPGGHWTSPAGLAVVLIAVMVAVAGALFTPDLWPLSL